MHFQTISSSAVHNYANVVFQPSSIVADTWTKLTATFQVTNRCYFRPFIFYLGNGTILHVRDIKLELGNKATDWTPAPEDVDDAIIDEKIKELNLTSLIDSLPSGYDTLIKDAGLSRGQKQLIALARTMIADPKILILDEATSNVDTRTELMVQRGLKVLMKGRTSFIVAHRLSTIRNADEIFVVGNKTIMERGNHDELMKIEGGEYRSLYEAQFALIDTKG